MEIPPRYSGDSAEILERQAATAAVAAAAAAAAAVLPTAAGWIRGGTRSSAASEARMVATPTAITVTTAATAAAATTATTIDSFFHYMHYLTFLCSLGVRSLGIIAARSDQLDLVPSYSVVASSLVGCAF